MPIKMHIKGSTHQSMKQRISTLEVVVVKLSSSNNNNASESNKMNLNSNHSKANGN